MKSGGQNVIKNQGNEKRKWLHNHLGGVGFGGCGIDFFGGVFSFAGAAKIAKRHHRARSGGADAKHRAKLFG